MRRSPRAVALASGALAAACVLALGVVQADVRRPTGHHIELRGDGAMLNVARQVAEGYMREHPDAVVTVSGGGSYRGVKSLLQNTADLALVTGEIPDELQKVAREAKVDLVKHDVYRDAVVVVVHESNPIADLSRDQVRDVYRGAITNWKELGGKDAPIQLLTWDPSLGVYETFKREVLGEGAVVSPRALTVPWSEFRNTFGESSIGYFGVHALGRYEAGPSKAIRIGGVAAKTETLASGQYPIQRYLSVYHRADAQPAVQALVADFRQHGVGGAIFGGLGGEGVIWRG
jgi:phosphate transport system substrate-binding protein